MTLRDRILQRIDVRPGEIRRLLLLTAGSFLVVSFMVVARALREAVFLTTFDIKMLPYITLAVAVLGFPAVMAFTRVLQRTHPSRVMYGLVAITITGLLILLAMGPGTKVGSIALYIWTALCTLLLTSGFWIVTAEYFAVRAAKRLYGIIGAGGTVGALLCGISLSWFTNYFSAFQLLPMLIIPLLLYALVQAQLLRGHEEPAHALPAPTSRSMHENIRLVGQTPHLRTIALIVFLATIASTVVDYQFKDLARMRYDAPGSLTSFFGAFYGWTGGVALLLQLFVAARLMAVGGIAASLAVLPMVLLIGSGGLLLIPSLLLATLVRGADNSLRKSIHRQLVEFLYVPLPPIVRRSTKTFIDSVVDSLGEGTGALLILITVTLLDVPARYLSAFVMLMAFLFLLSSQRMGREYFSTVVARLKEEEAEVALRGGAEQMNERHLLSASFSRMDIQSLLTGTGLSEPYHHAPTVDSTTPAKPTGRLDQLASPDDQTVLGALKELKECAEIPNEEIAAMARLLARDSLYRTAVRHLADCGDLVVPVLADLLRNEHTDFVIRRRLPAVLSCVGGPAADDVLIEALSANRFEVRYRSAVALVRRRKHDLPRSARDWESLVWTAIEQEVHRDRPIWELQKLLDEREREDDLVLRRVGTRGQTSLEHTFRMLTLVLDPDPVRAAFHGIVLKDESLQGYALEYLDQALPSGIREKLWVFIGDLSRAAQSRGVRSLDRVVSDLVSTRATLFAGEQERDALKKMLEDQES